MLGQHVAKRQLEILETLKSKPKGYSIVCSDHSDLYEEFLENQLSPSQTPRTKDGDTYYQAWEKAHK